MKKRRNIGNPFLAQHRAQNHKPQWKLSCMFLLLFHLSQQHMDKHIKLQNNIISCIYQGRTLTRVPPILTDLNRLTAFPFSYAHFRIPQKTRLLVRRSLRREEKVTLKMLNINDHQRYFKYLNQLATSFSVQA